MATFAREYEPTVLAMPAIRHHICFVTHGSLDRHATIKRAFGMAPCLVEMGQHVSICLEDCTANRQVMRGLPSVQPLWYARQAQRAERGSKATLVRSSGASVVHICGLGFRNAIEPPAGRHTLTIMDHVELESSIGAVLSPKRLAQYGLEWLSAYRYEAHIAASDYLLTLFSNRAQLLRRPLPVLYLPFACDDTLETRLSALRGGRATSPPQTSTLFYMGGFYEAYGCFEMLDAITKLRQRRNDFRAVLCGRGPELQRMKGEVFKRGLSDFVELPGFLPLKQLHQELARADILLSPLRDTVTDHARCPSKTYEYLAAKVPIVTCKIGENASVLGASGFYYQPGDPCSFAAAIDTALAALPQWTAGYKVIDHCWSTRCRTYLAWLNTLITARQ